MSTFDELVASRRAWINEMLEPWCRQAALADLKKAEQEWGDIAGRADPETTLWTWAWSRFPDLVHEGLRGVDETSKVTVTLNDGRTASGFPDSRKSKDGQLVILGIRNSQTGELEESGPYSIDDIQSVEKAPDE